MSNDWPQFVGDVATALRDSVSLEEPLRLLGYGYDFVNLVDASDAVFRIPRGAGSAARLRRELSLLPQLSSLVSVQVPKPTPLLETAELPWGGSRYELIDGTPLDRWHGPVTNLADDLAQFLAQLHSFPVDDAVSLGVEPADTWTSGFEALGEKVIPPLRDHVSTTEHDAVRRWWEGFIGQLSSWRFTPSLIHGDLSAEHVLVSDQGLVGVIDFGEVRVGDPAFDVAGLSSDARFGDQALDVWTAYERSVGAHDSEMPMRAAAYRAMSVFWLTEVALSGRAGDGILTLEETLAVLRSGPILAR